MACNNSEDEILDLTRSKPTHNSKPNMRLNPAMLQGSSLVQSLPDFLERMANANRELKVKGAAEGFELTDEQAASRQHIEMDLYAGVMKRSKGRHRGQIKLPTSHESEDEGVSTDASGDSNSGISQNEASDAESILASTETSRHKEPRKRTASCLAGPSEAQTPPSKIRVTSRRASPARSTDSSSSGSSGSSIGSTRIIKIKVPSKSPSSGGSDSSSSSSSPGRNIITLRDPRKTPSPQPIRQSIPSSVVAKHSTRKSSSDSESSASGRKVRIKVVSPPKPANSPGDGGTQRQKRLIIEELE